MTTSQIDRPHLAPMDSLSREIQAVLDLIRPHSDTEAAPKFGGYAVSAAEAYLHLARERDPSAELRVVRNGSGREAHWWLADTAGRVIDLTLSPADRRQIKATPVDRYPYEQGRGAMFRTGPARPSKRAMAIIELVRSEVANRGSRAVAN